jgi:tetratricopeptide (TPR) repeat protein
LAFQLHQNTLYLYQSETVIMENNNSESKLNSAESNFIDFVQRGDDFYKIELLRQAKAWYEKALKIYPDNGMVKSRIAECIRKLAFENKVVYILISIVSVLVLFYYLFLHI